MPIVSLSLPEPLLEKVDYFIRRYGYTGRSEFVRDAIREYIASRFPEESLGGVIYGIIVALTNHEAKPSVDQKVIDTIHAHQTMIKSFYHQLLKDGWCLNIAIIESSWRDVQALLKSLRKIKGVDDLKFIPLKVDGGVT